MVEKTMIKLVYKPVSLLVSVLSGVLAGAIFKQLWRVSAREDDAPKATDARRGWHEILPAAALQGAVKEDPQLVRQDLTTGEREWSESEHHAARLLEPQPGDESIELLPRVPVVWQRGPRGPASESEPVQRPLERSSHRGESGTVARVEQVAEPPAIIGTHDQRAPPFQHSNELG